MERKTRHSSKPPGDSKADDKLGAVGGAVGGAPGHPSKTSREDENLERAARDLSELAIDGSSKLGRRKRRKKPPKKGDPAIPTLLEEGDSTGPKSLEGGDATKPKRLEEALISNHLVANDATKPKCLEGELCVSGGIVKRHTYKGEDYNIHHSNSFGTTACIPDTARVSAKVNEEHDYDGKGYSVYHGGSVEDRVKGIIWHGDKDKIIESLDDDKIMMQYTLLASYKDQERGGDRETETPAEETAIHAEEDPPAPIAETERSDSGTDANRDRVSWTLSGSEASNPLS